MVAKSLLLLIAVFGCQSLAFRIRRNRKAEKATKMRDQQGNEGVAEDALSVAKARMVRDTSFVLANFGSGGNTGKKIAKHAQDTEGIPAVNLAAARRPEAQGLLLPVMAKSFENMERMQPALRVICAGGDGTSSWCIAIINFLLAQLAKTTGQKLPRGKVSIVMCPLGTGNDLARSLGLGDTSPADLSDYFARVLSPTATFTDFDIWTIFFDLKSKRYKNSTYFVDEQSPHLLERFHDGWPMLLYFSTGYDAAVVNAFRRWKGIEVFGREIISAQPLNKIEYALQGAKTISFGGSELHGREKLGVAIKTEKGWIQDSDDPLANKSLDVDEGGSVAIMNTPSMASGMSFWGDKIEEGYHPAHVDDQRLEVVSSESALAVPALKVQKAVPVLKVGEGKYRRLAQPATVTMKFSPKMDWKAGRPVERPFQIDGEPFMLRGRKSRRQTNWQHSHVGGSKRSSPRISDQCSEPV